MPAVTDVGERARFASGRNREKDETAHHVTLSMRSFWKFRGVCRTFSKRLPGAATERVGIYVGSGAGRGQYPPLRSSSPEMWFNRPAYNSYTPYGYGYSSFEDPYVRATRERAAREREAAARRADLLRWQQMQDAARSPYNSYLSDDDEGSFASYPYNPRAHDYVTHEDLKRRQILERQRQLEWARQAELDRREAERVRELAEHTSKLQEVSFVE